MKTIKSSLLFFILVVGLLTIVVISSTQFKIDRMTGHYECALPASVILVVVSVVMMFTISNLIDTLKSK